MYTTSDARWDEQANRHTLRAQADWAEDGYKIVQPILTSSEAVKAVKAALMTCAKNDLDADFTAIVEDKLDAYLASELGNLVDAVIG